MKLHAAILLITLIGPGLAGHALAADGERRPFGVEDLDQVRAVVDPTISPEGDWVAYSVRTTDAAREYELELGVPWKNLDAYLRNSYPFLHADRIVTPTLFMCGERDFNVPLLNSAQMYQAVRGIGVETQLIIYPGQFHALGVPSYLRDRLQRQIGWYRKHLMAPSGSTSGSPVRPARAPVVARPAAS